MKNTKTRILMIALLIISSVVVLTACAPKPAAPTAAPAATAVVTNAPAVTAVVTNAPAATAVVTDAPAVAAVVTDVPADKAALPVLTAEELAKFDGLNGNKAYIAFEGTVYNVSGAPQWSAGAHGGNKAGTDITAALKAAPHGTVKLDGLPVVGTLKALDDKAALPVFTVEELAKFDGLNGNKAYVAFEGTVYDVSGALQWSAGAHGGNKAGTDITAALKAAPHGTVKLDGLPVVGTLKALDDKAALPVFTAEELAKFDGLNGNKAYITFEGTVYDVSGAPQWSAGAHGGNKAGTDITAALKAAPHGTVNLDGLPVVGTYTAPSEN